MANVLSPTKAPRKLAELPRCLISQEGFVDAVTALQSGRPASFDGVWGSSCALLAAALSTQAPTALLVVSPRLNHFDDLSDDLELFLRSDAQKFPAWETDPGEHKLGDDVFGDRLRLLKQLSTSAADLGPTSPGVPTTQVFTTSIQALLQAVPAKKTVARNTRVLAAGSTVDVDELLDWLVRHKFHHTSAVELPGEFSARGGIVDIFAPDWIRPVRIEFFDTEVESIRSFEVSSQRSLERLDQVEITVLAPEENADAHFTGYLPPDTWMLLVEPGQVEEEGRQYLKRLSSTDGCHSVSSVLKQLYEFPLATASSLAEGAFETKCQLQVESIERFGAADLSAIKSELDKVGDGHEVHLVVQTEAEVERLQEILSSTSLAARGKLHYTVGHLHHGFRLVRDRIIVISGGELFHRGELRRSPRRHLGKAIDSFLDLRQGDLVVHLGHGIGRYRGLKLLTKDEHVEEHLEIEFHGRTKIYVPASKIDLVQKYVGGTKGRPSLARIGGTAWQKQKKAAEAAVTDLAAEMLEVQAARSSRAGIAFGADTEWQREFDSSFPHQETPDQLSAWGAINQNMQSASPMDRLLCGDVGFGKTEVSMRAAFKAVESGYQVALLAPTTILVEQHFQSFRERMAEFPFDIARLSRFCTPKEQREAVAKLAMGQIDIVIGTHRLASKDVEFYNLGLVIIDEEQRFGVEVKQRLKTFRTTVDVLTMSATPIPRTLHMSLVGVRDISNLETPPEERIAVETRVTRFNAEIIRHAVMRELNRGGQIFFVHNRVNDIHVVEQKLKHIVPEASVRIGHGQMPENELERVMVDFVNHEFDLLLATTIVESGLDIPNANTIFIDEADRYGLADLHQLRGRVGRYKHRAYAYLLIDPHKHVTPLAAKRLRAIEEFSEMGAGFAIAMRDLEIRGAGNLLGTQQSGHIATVGYELYCQLLETAVRQLKKMPAKLSIDVDVDLPGKAYLPDDYVSDMRQKIDLYRRLTRTNSFDDLAQFEAELVDRFGKAPDAVKRMLSLAEVKLEAAVWQIQAIHMEDRDVVFTYADRRRVEQLSKMCSGKLRVVDENQAYVRLSKGVENPDLVLRAVKSVLQAE